MLNTISPKARIFTGIRFAKPQFPEFSNRQKIAIVLGMVATLFYDWAIGAGFHPIVRLILALFFTWYCVIGEIGFRKIWNHYVPLTKMTPFLVLIQMVLFFSLIYVEFKFSVGIEDWINQRLRENGTYTVTLALVNSNFQLLCFIVLPYLFINRRPPTDMQTT